MNRKTALITGGTSGVGLSMVRALAKAGFDVHFIGTNAERGQQIEQSLNEAGTSTCRFIKLDLSDLTAVKAFADTFKSEVATLDVLANVAGLLLTTRHETKEGFEKTFVIDYLSAVLLSLALAPVLAAASHGRIVNVSGAPSHVLRQLLDFDDFDFKKNYSAIRAAFHSVHAKTVATEILAEKLRGDGIDVNAFHPGTVKSDLGRSLAFPLKQLMAVAAVFMSSETKSGIYCSSAEELNGVTGAFFVGKKHKPLRFDAAYKTQLWSVTEQMLAQAFPQGES
mgnify:CR=1 FL=1